MQFVDYFLWYPSVKQKYLAFIDLEKELEITWVFVEDAVAQWVECQTANQAAQVRIPANTNGLFYKHILVPSNSEPAWNCESKRKGPAPTFWCGDEETGSMPQFQFCGPEGSPIKHDTVCKPRLQMFVQYWFQVRRN